MKKMIDSEKLKEWIDNEIIEHQKHINSRNHHCIISSERINELKNVLQKIKELEEVQYE